MTCVPSGPLRTSPMSAQTSVLIWGAGGHAVVIEDILRLDGRFTVTSFIDEVDPSPRQLCGVPVLPGRGALASVRAQGVRHAIVGIGQCDARLVLARLLVDEGFTLVTAVHPGAIAASSAEIGAGTVIGAGAVVGVRTRLGASVIVNTRASVDHDCVLEEGVHVCPAACLAGGVHIGAGAWIGAGATVIDGMSIGAGTVVGAGAVVVRPLPGGVVAYGVPARPVRQVRR